MALTLYPTPAPLYRKHSVALVQEVSPSLSWCFCSSDCDLCVLWCNSRGGTWDVIVALQNYNQQVLGVQS